MQGKLNDSLGGSDLCRSNETYALFMFIDSYHRRFFLPSQGRKHSTFPGANGGKANGRAAAVPLRAPQRHPDQLQESAVVGRGGGHAGPRPGAPQVQPARPGAPPERLARRPGHDHVRGARVGQRPEHWHVLLRGLSGLSPKPERHHPPRQVHTLPSRQVQRGCK